MEPLILSDTMSIGGTITTALIPTTDVAFINMLRRAIMTEVETYAIGLVVFHINTSARPSEVLALRFGQLVIDQFDGVPLDDLKVRLDVRGPAIVTTDDIIGLKFTYKTPILTLRADQQLLCDCIVKREIGRTHVKWRPISRFTLKPVENGHEIMIEGLGMMSGEDIIRKGLAKIDTATQRPPQTLFSRPLAPTQTLISPLQT